MGWSVTETDDRATDLLDQIIAISKALLDGSIRDVSGLPIWMSEKLVELSEKLVAALDETGKADE